ncbi:hypothetical protein BCR32DRAFT_292899 [Anaeromyces robustus]|uniref:RING-type domain-containing protein n=1 Tax=Anaeromyces robustus TaxID=1754192 RepID=A0A1Y1X8J7_9FUNG|nr:hypothetical protein BCR32DRAFT_292899 [Anaeromyces robustus]|eukprot:ORX82070.1 hypothetical protein BCR32DRAFT_292899 [Anaeromyces robustus]
MDGEIKENMKLLKTLNFGYVNPVNVNLLCPICRLPLLNPIATSCGHTFCEECILSSLEISNKCPYDRKDIKKEDFKKVDRLILNILNELEIYCPNKVNGCPFICQRQYLYQHYHECEYEFVDCPNKKCNKKVIKKDLEEHINECDFKEIECEFCKEMYYRKDKMNHIKNCKEFENSEITSKEDMVIECKYKNFGCSWKDKFKNLEEHEKTCPYHQFQGFFDNVYLKNQKQLENENQELKKKVYQLTDEISFLKKELDVYKNNNNVPQQQAISESIVELDNEIQLLKCDMQNTNLTLNDLEVRYNMMVIDENIRLREEIQSLRASFQSIQYQVLSFMKYIKGTLHSNVGSTSTITSNTSFANPILNQKCNTANTNNNILPSSKDDNASSTTPFLPTTYNSSKLIKSASTSFDYNSNNNNNSNNSNNNNNGNNSFSRNEFYGYNYSNGNNNIPTRVRSNSDTGSINRYETIHRERRFSKI